MQDEMAKLDPNSVVSTEKAEYYGRKLKVGIIGTGWIADCHAEVYKDMPDVELVAGADIISGKTERFFGKWEIPEARSYESHTEMLEKEELDAVSVCTYNTSHAVCTIDALDKGVHVLLEKPMCVTLDEGIDIMKAERRSGKILSVGFQPRFDPNMQMIKKIVDSGELGEVYYIQTGGGRRKGIPTPFGTSFIEKDTGGIGALGDIGCYSLDMVLNAVGYPKPLTVSGYKSDFFGKNPKYYKNEGKPERYADLFGVDDFAAGFIRLENGIILDFRIAWAMNIDTPCDTIILGKKAGLRIPSTDCWNGTFYKPMVLYKDIEGSLVEFEIPLIKDNGPGLFTRKIRSFIDAIQSNGDAPISSRQIIYNQAIIDGIVKSAEAGREIEVVIPDII